MPFRAVPPLATLALVAACAQPEPLTGSLPLFGDGYRFKGDACLRVAEDDYTNQFLDDASDLVACPEDLENLGVFVIDTGAVEVARRDGYVLYSVPLR